MAKEQELRFTNITPLQIYIKRSGLKLFLAGKPANACRLDRRAEIKSETNQEDYTK